MNTETAISLITLALYIVIPLVMTAIFFFIGRVAERRHEASLTAREEATAAMVCTTLRRPAGVDASRPPMLVAGEVVVASDKFKTILFGFRNVFGGESKTFTRLYDRARRESTLRMLEEAQRQGFNAVCNVRYGAVDVGGSSTSAAQKKNPMAVCMAVGTAYVQG